MNHYSFLFWRGLAAGIMACFLLSANSIAQRRPAGGGVQKQTGRQTQNSRPSTGSGGSGSLQRNNQTSNRNATNNRKGNAGKGGNLSNNKVNIDKSRGDVNFNVDNSKDIRINNSRNTSIRRNTYRPYTRPPMVYGGFHYRCYHPYYYHPYRPFYWGPVWHPWGFFLATLTATAIIVSFADADLPAGVLPQDHFVMVSISGGKMRGGPSLFEFGTSEHFEQVDADGEYYYDQGVFYLKADGGYTTVAAPLGAIVKSLPKGYETVQLDEAGSVTNYYWGGTFYEKISNGYKVVPPTSGAVVEHLAEGGEEVKMGDVTYVKLGETYYQPMQQNGKNMYEVVDVEKAK
jgi:heme exporter protein D